jgi:hypothetical protein
VLRDETALAALLDALHDADRLVLLGDIVELRQGPARDALQVARPLLQALGESLRDGAEAVIVPGNHDHQLLAGWLDRRSRTAPPPPLGLEQSVDWRVEEPLATIAQALAGGRANVRAAYPGVWLRDDVYAMHGHYCDPHTTVPMFERLGAGVMRRITGLTDGGPRTADDYERILAPIYAWLYSLAQHGGPSLGRSSHGASAQAWRTLEGGAGRRRTVRDRVRRRSVRLAFPALLAALNRAQVGPLHADLSGPELRRAALRACGEVVMRLDVDAREVIFGHTHRAGPLPGDARDEWVAPNGPRLTNTGCWVHEPSFLGPRPHESPYRTGFAVALDDDEAPRLLNLLDSRQDASPGVKQTA